MKCIIHKDTPKCRPGVPFELGVDCRVCWLGMDDKDRIEIDYNDIPVDNKSIIPLKLFNRCEYWTGEKKGYKVDHDGNISHKNDCGCRTVYKCKIKDNIIIGNKVKGHEVCTCDNYSSNVKRNDKTIFNNCVVAIGHYNMPCAVEFHLKSIKANCGNVHILVTDDYSEEAYNLDPSKGRIVSKESAFESKQRLIGVCHDYNAKLINTGQYRLGHVGGDLSAYYHGLMYAKNIGAKYCIKMSQRFFVDRPLWVQKLCRIAEENNVVTMSNPHIAKNGQLVFHIRSEFVLMNVEKWTQPHILDIIKPRRVGGVAGEMIITHAVQNLGGVITPCPLFTANRGSHHPGLVWYEENDAVNKYIAFMKKYNVEMSDGFHIQYAPHNVNWIG